jgi:hypothetical protein
MRLFVKGCVVAGLGCVWMSALSGCSLARKNDPQRPLVDKIRPAPVGSFGPGATERVPPPESEACTLGTARQCYEHALAFASGQGGQKDFIQAVALLSKACDGRVEEACRTLSLRMKRPERLSPSPQRSEGGRSGTGPTDADDFARLRCRLVDPGVLRGCEVVFPLMAGSRRARVLESVSSYRYALPTFDGAAFESDYTLTVDLDSL